MLMFLVLNLGCLVVIIVQLKARKAVTQSLPVASQAAPQESPAEQISQEIGRPLPIRPTRQPTATAAPVRPAITGGAERRAIAQARDETENITWRLAEPVAGSNPGAGHG